MAHLLDQIRYILLATCKGLAPRDYMYFCSCPKVVNRLLVACMELELAHIDAAARGVCAL